MPVSKLNNNMQLISKISLNSGNCQKIFWIFALLHLTLWTILPSLARHELDTDSMMHFAWGQEWMWSYRLHPPVLPWVVAGFLETFGINNWTYNLLTQLNFLVAFFCIWRLSREFLNPVAALAAVCILEFLPYFSFFCMRLNHTSMLIPIWALTILLAYFALKHNHYKYWIGLGLIAAISMLTKYYSASLLAGIALYILIFPQQRAKLKTPGPYLALGIFLLIMIGHIWHVTNNQIGTVTHIGDYLKFNDLAVRWRGIRFLLAQMIYLIPLILIVFIANINKFKKKSANSHHLDSPVNSVNPMQSFVYWMFFFPLLSTALMGALVGIDISSRWGGPTLSLAGIVIFLKFKPLHHYIKCTKLIIFSFIWACSLPIFLLFTGLAAANHHMHHFPGKELGQKITEMWHKKYQQPLAIVGGGHDAPDSIAFHSPDHPSVLQHLSHKWSPWITAEDIKKHGIAIVCLDTDKICWNNAEKLFPSNTFKDIKIKAQPGLFFPGSERIFRYFFVSPGKYVPDLHTISPMPMRELKTKSD